MPAQAQGGSSPQRVNPTKLPAAGVRTKNLIKRPNKFGPATPDADAKSVAAAMAGAGGRASGGGQSAGAAPGSASTARSWNPNASGGLSASASASGAALSASAGGATGRKWTEADRDGVQRSPVDAHNQSLLARSGGAIAGAAGAGAGAGASAGAAGRAAGASAGGGAWTAAQAAAAAADSPRASTAASTTRARRSADGKWDVSDAPAGAADARPTVVGAAFFDGGDPSNRRITFASGLGFGRGHPWFNSYLNFPNAKLGTLTPADLQPLAGEQHALDPFAGGLGFGTKHQTYYAYMHSNAKHARPPK